jgi:outer membrane protein OmpA-like peptidoglycan-associated protein
VAVGDDAEPWYLTLPAVAEEPNGYTAVAAEGTADGVETSTRTGDTVEVSLATDVLFATGSAELNGEAAARLADLAGVISDQAAAGAVTITGHTDDVGDDASNQTLSEQRAASVQAALEQAVGRPDLRFSTSGSGESDPVAPNAIDGRPNPDGQARNRRVTIEYEAS